MRGSYVCKKTSIGILVKAAGVQKGVPGVPCQARALGVQTAQGLTRKSLHLVSILRGELGGLEGLAGAPRAMLRFRN